MLAQRRSFRHPQYGWFQLTSGGDALLTWAVACLPVIVPIPGSLTRAARLTFERASMLTWASGDIVPSVRLSPERNSPSLAQLG